MKEWWCCELTVSKLVCKILIEINNIEKKLMQILHKSSYMENVFLNFRQDVDFCR